MKLYCGLSDPSAGSRGFTLFELLIVLFIIGMASALVLPRIAATLPGTQLKSAARAVAASLRYARSKAAYESTPYIALFDSTRKTLAVQSIDTAIDVTELPRIKEILSRSDLQRVYAFPQGIDFSVPGQGETDLFAILFYPRGDSTGGKIVLKGVNRKRYTITIDTIMGSVEIDR